MNLSFIQLIRFRGDITPESSNECPWISIWRLAKPHAEHAGCVCWIDRLLRENQAKELVARDAEAAISSTASASTPIASASNRAWTLSHLWTCWQAWLS